MQPPPRYQTLPLIPDGVKERLQRIGCLRCAGLLEEPSFKYAVQALTREELQPRGLELLVRELSDGRTRFLLREGPTGRVFDLIDCAA